MLPVIFTDPGIDRGRGATEGMSDLYKEILLLVCTPQPWSDKTCNQSCKEE